MNWPIMVWAPSQPIDSDMPRNICSTTSVQMLVAAGAGAVMLSGWKDDGGAPSRRGEVSTQGAARADVNCAAAHALDKAGRRERSVRDRRRRARLLERMSAPEGLDLEAGRHDA